MQVDVQRSLTHYLNGDTERYFSSVRQDGVAPILNPPWSENLHDSLVRRERLFSAQHPRLRIICPSYFLKDQMTIRELSKGELLHLYQLPFSMDALMSDA